MFYQQQYVQAVHALRDSESKYTVRDEHIVFAVESNYSEDFIRNYDENINSTNFKQDNDTCKYALSNQTLSTDCQTILLGTNKAGRPSLEINQLPKSNQFLTTVLRRSYDEMDIRQIIFDTDGTTGYFVKVPIVYGSRFFIERFIGGFGMSISENLIILQNNDGEILKSFVIPIEKRILFISDIDKNGIDEIIYMIHEGTYTDLGALHIEKSN